MLTVRGESIPHHLQRYNTCGDWMGHDNFRQIMVSEMGNPDFELMVFIHEVVEQALCLKRGITDETVTKFDKEYQGEDEPGDDPLAPYHREHVYATAIEMSLAKELGIDMKAYDEALEKVYLSKKG